MKSVVTLGLTPWFCRPVQLNSHQLKGVYCSHCVVVDYVICASVLRNQPVVFVPQVVLDHDTYYMDLVAANKGNPDWKLEYSAKV